MDNKSNHFGSAPLTSNAGSFNQDRFKKKQELLKDFRKSEEWKHFFQFRKNFETYRVQLVKINNDRHTKMKDTIQEYNGQEQGNNHPFDDRRLQIEEDRRKIIKRRAMIKLEPTAEEMSDDNKSAPEQLSESNKVAKSTSDVTNGSDMEHKTTNQTLRQKIQQLQDNREQSKNKNQVTTNTYAQLTYPRNLEGAPTTEATSSTTMFETYDPTTST